MFIKARWTTCLAILVLLTSATLTHAQMSIEEIAENLSAQLGVPANKLLNADGDFTAEVQKMMDTRPEVLDRLMLEILIADGAKATDSQSEWVDEETWNTLTILQEFQPDQIVDAQGALTPAALETIKYRPDLIEKYEASKAAPEASNAAQEPVHDEKPEASKAAQGSVQDRQPLSAEEVAQRLSEELVIPMHKLMGADGKWSAEARKMMDARPEVLDRLMLEVLIADGAKVSVSQSEWVNEETWNTLTLLKKLPPDQIVDAQGALTPAALEVIKYRPDLVEKYEASKAALPSLRDRQPLIPSADLMGVGYKYGKLTYAYDYVSGFMIPKFAGNDAYLVLKDGSALMNMGAPSDLDLDAILKKRGTPFANYEERGLYKGSLLPPRPRGYTVNIFAEDNIPGVGGPTFRGILLTEEGHFKLTSTRMTMGPSMGGNFARGVSSDEMSGTYFVDGNTIELEYQDGTRVRSLFGTDGIGRVIIGRTDYRVWEDKK